MRAGGGLLLFLFAGCSFDPSGVAAIDAGVSDASPPDAAVDAARVECPSGYLLDPGGERGYRFVDASSERGAALADCADDGVGQTHLVIVDDDAENVHVHAIALDETVWLGIDDVTAEGTWTTVLDSVQTYFHWGDAKAWQFKVAAKIKAGDMAPTSANTALGHDPGLTYPCGACIARPASAASRSRTGCARSAAARAFDR